MVNLRCESSQHEMRWVYNSCGDRLDLSIFYFKRSGPDACGYLVESGEDLAFLKCFPFMQEMARTEKREVGEGSRQ